MYTINQFLLKIFVNNNYITIPCYPKKIKFDLYLILVISILIKNVQIIIFLGLIVTDLNLVQYINIKMLNNKRILAIVPARGGSKRIPRKNIKPFFTIIFVI